MEPTIIFVSFAGRSRVADLSRPDALLLWVPLTHALLPRGAVAELPATPSETRRSRLLATSLLERRCPPPSPRCHAPPRQRRSAARACVAPTDGAVEAPSSPSLRRDAAPACRPRLRRQPWGAGRRPDPGRAARAAGSGGCRASVRAAFARVDHPATLVAQRLSARGGAGRGDGRGETWAGARRPSRGKLCTRFSSSAAAPAYLRRASAAPCRLRRLAVATPPVHLPTPGPAPCLPSAVSATGALRPATCPAVAISATSALSIAYIAFPLRRLHGRRRMPRRSPSLRRLRSLRRLWCVPTPPSSQPVRLGLSRRATARPIARLGACGGGSGCGQACATPTAAQVATPAAARSSNGVPACATPATARRSCDVPAGVSLAAARYTRPLCRRLPGGLMPASHSGAAAACTVGQRWCGSLVLALHSTRRPNLHGFEHLLASSARDACVVLASSASIMNDSQHGLGSLPP
ncbi:hypothetical protein BS78_03G066400 [Paspalum vaginatum]|nr:hypothetical protein BS78_03G066400 [Paspalum vaginatum]